MVFINFLILFLQECRVFISNHFESEPKFIMISVLGLQLLLFFAEVSSSKKLSMPKIALLLLFFIPLYLFNNFALHCVFIILYIMNTRHLSLKKVVQMALAVNLIFLALSILMLLSGLVHNEIWNMSKGAANTLGFTNPNSTARSLITAILVFSFYLVLYKKSLFLNFLLLIPGYAIYRITFGRTYFIGLVIYYLFLLLFKSRLFYKHNYWLYKIAPLLLGSLLIIGIRIYEAFPLVDLFFSSRLSFSKAVLDEFSSINYILGSSFIPEGLTIDSSYLYIFCEAGILSVLAFMLLYSLFVKKISPSEAKIFFPFVFCLLIMGVSEITFPAFSVATAIFYKILYQTANKKSKQEVLV